MSAARWIPRGAQFNLGNSRIGIVFVFYSTIHRQTLDRCSKKHDKKKSHIKIKVTHYNIRSTRREDGIEQGGQMPRTGGAPCTVMFLMVLSFSVARAVGATCAWEPAASPWFTTMCCKYEVWVATMREHGSQGSTAHTPQWCGMSLYLARRPPSDDDRPRQAPDTDMIITTARRLPRQQCYTHC